MSFVSVFDEIVEAKWKNDVARVGNGLTQALSGTAKTLPMRRERGRMVYFIVDPEIMVLLSLVMVEFRSSYSTVDAWGPFHVIIPQRLTSTGNHCDENCDEEKHE
jgi:hypothetical protein